MKPLDQLSDKVSEHGYVMVGINDHYKLYAKSEKKNPPLTAKLYKEVLRFIFIRIWNYMFKERWIFNAPANFGQFYVKESLNNDNSFKDWKKSKEIGSIVRKFNAHSKGRSFYITWNKLLTKMHHKTKYRFIPYRGSAEELSGKRGLAAWVKESSINPYLADFRGHLI